MYCIVFFFILVIFLLSTSYCYLPHNIFYLYYIGFFWRAILVMIVWLLDLQLPMQSVSITTEVVNLNPAQGRCTRYNNM